MREYIPDELLDAEIKRLRSSPDVKLDEKYRRIKYRKRNYLAELRASEKRGKELRKLGINEETLTRELFEAHEADDCGC